MSDHDELTDSRPGGRHERRDVEWKPVLIGGLLLVAMTALILLATAGFLSLIDDRTAVRRQDTPPEPLRGPGLESRPGEVLSTYRELQSEELNSYGWVDRSRGVVRIPVSRAMEVIAERGLPETSGQFTRLDMVRRKARGEGRNE